MTKEDVTDLSKVQDLAEDIYATAATFDKKLRHPVSDAAKLISWMMYAEQQPDDEDAKRAIASLKESLSKP